MTIVLLHVTNHASLWVQEEKQPGCIEPHVSYIPIAAVKPPASEVKSTECSRHTKYAVKLSCSKETLVSSPDTRTHHSSLLVWQNLMSVCRQIKRAGFSNGTELSRPEGTQRRLLAVLLHEEASLELMQALGSARKRSSFSVYALEQSRTLLQAAQSQHGPCDDSSGRCTEGSVFMC